MHRPEKNQNGIAMMVVLWVLVLLIALATEFAFSMKMEINTTRNFKEDFESYYLAKAGIALAMSELLKPARFHSIHPDHGWASGKPLIPAKSVVEKTRFDWGVRSLPWLILTDKENIVRAEGFSINELDERITTLSVK